MNLLNIANGTVVGRVQIAPGVAEIEYSLPGKKYANGYPTKTVYDPKIFSDAKMGEMAQEAAAKGMIQYQLGDGYKLPNGSLMLDVLVNGINFKVPINNGRIPSVFPGRRD